MYISKYTLNKMSHVLSSFLTISKYLWIDGVVGTDNDG